MFDRPFQITAWYWQIGDDTSRYWSSAASAYVDTLPDGAGFTRIASEAELTDVLFPFGLVGPLPRVLTITPKNLLWARATDAEAAQMEAALQSQPVRLRRIYEGATHISKDDELYGMLSGALVALFGTRRADQLLEPVG